MGRNYGMNGATIGPALSTYDLFSGRPVRGPYASGSPDGGDGPTPTQRVGTPYRGLGKTNISQPMVGPPLSQNTPFQGLAPRMGVAEGIIGGLVEQFTGALPGFARDPLVGLAHGVGQVLDVPLELAGHVPLPWVPDVQEAFDRLPVTAQTQQIKQLALDDPDTALRYMSQYLRMHEQEYMEALGMPRMFSPLMMPDANILERALGVLGMPQQVIARTYAGTGLRNVEDTILNAPANSLPQPLEEVRLRRLSGDLTHDQFLDEITQLGYAFTNDAFANFFLSMVSDPIIVGSFGTGAALGAMERGSLALRTARANARVAQVAPEAHAAATAKALARTTNDIRTQSPLTPLEAASEQAAALAKAATDPLNPPRGRAGVFNEWVRDGIREIDPALMDDALQYAEGTLTRRQRAVVRMEPIVRATGSVARVLNEPFRVFGTDRAADMVGALRSDAHARGALDAYGYGNVRALAKALGVPQARFIQSLGTWMANSEMSLVHRNSMVKQIKARGGLPENMADATPNARIREVNLMAPDVLVNESKREAARAMPDYVLDTSHLTPEEAARARTVFREEQEGIAIERLVASTGMSREAATKFIKGGNDKRLALAEGLFYGRSVHDMIESRTLDANAYGSKIEAAAAAGDQVEVARLTALRDLVHRYTLLGAREMSLDDAKELLGIVESGAADAANRAREFINRFDVLHQNFERMYDEDGRLIEDAVLLDRLAVWLRDNISGGEDGVSSFPTVVDYDTLGDSLKSFIDENRRVNGGEQFAYRIAVAPAAKDQWRVSTDATGRLVGVNPWVEATAESAPAFVPTNWDTQRNRLFSPIRGEKLLFQARSRFIRRATEVHNLGRREAINLFEAVRKTASERNIQPRGLSMDEFRGIVDGVAEGLSPNLRQRLGDDGLALLTAQAFEGEMATVGLSVKLTGKMKTRSAGMGNWVGVVSEKLYPMMRFTANPIFQMQEWLEPYFFNIIRGVRPGLQWTAEDRAVLAMLDRWKLGTMFSDQAEYAYTAAQGWMSTHRPETSFGPGGQIAIANEKRMKVRDVKDRKMLNYIRDVKADSGQRWKRYMLNSAPAQWAEMEQHYGTTNAGEIAVRYWIEKGVHHADDPHYQTFLATGYIPNSIGKPHQVLMQPLAKTLGYRDPIALRKAISDGGLTEAQFRAHPVVSTFDPEFADRAWRTANFSSPEEWFDSLASSMRKGGRSAIEIDLSTRLARNMAQAGARAKGITLDEWMATHFAGKPVWVDSQRELPRAAYAQTMTSMREDIRTARRTYAGLHGGLPQRSADAAVTERAYRLLGGGPTETPVLIADRTIRAAEQAALGDGVPQMAEGILEVGTESFPMGFATDNTDDMLNSLATTVQEAGSRPTDLHEEMLAAVQTVTQLLSDEQVATLLRQNVVAHERIGMLPVTEGFVTDVVPSEVASWPGVDSYMRRALPDDLALYGHDGQGGGGLWHTTTRTDPVTEQGLRSRREVNAQGLGGGPDNTISLTYDEDHARLIAERQRVFAGAARGELTGDQVWDHFISTEWEHLYQRPYDALRTLDPDGDYRAPHWKDATDAEWRKAQRYFAREWDKRVAAGQHRSNWEMIQRADNAAHRMQGHWNNYNLQQGDPERIGGIIVVGDPDVAFASHAATPPESIRTVQVAVRRKPGRPIDWVQGEHELRVWPEDIQTLGDIEPSVSKVQGTMQDMRAEVAARMFAGYVRALDEDVAPGTAIQQMADVLHDISLKQKADPRGRTVVDHPLVAELVGDWEAGAPAAMSPFARDVMDQTFGAPKRSATMRRGTAPSFSVQAKAAAIDRHALHALGHWTPEYATAIARRMVKAGDATDIDDALGQLSARAGYDVRKPNPNQADPEVLYEWGVQKANALANAANAEDWGGRSDWTPGEMATLASTHARRIAEQHASEVEGGTVLRKALVTEVSPGFRRAPEWTNPLPPDELVSGPGSTLEGTLPQWDDLTDDQMRDVSRQVSLMAMDFVEQATGVRFVGSPIDIVMPRGGGAAAVSPLTGWSLMALTDEAADSAMDMIGATLQLDEVWGTKYTDALTADPSKGIHWALDLRLPSTATARHWDAFARYAAEAYPDGTRVLSARDTEGRQVVRIVWQPEEGVAQTTLDDFLAGMREAEAGIEDELHVGDWVNGLPDEFEWMRETILPVELDRHPVQVKMTTNRGADHPRVGSTFAHDERMARSLTRGGMTPEEAANDAIGRTYLDRLRARGDYGAEVAASVVGRWRDQAKSHIDDAYEQYAPSLAGPAAGRARLASLGGGARGETVQYQRNARGVRAALAYTDGARSTLYVLEHADPSSIVHEFAHEFARSLDESGKRALMTAYDATPTASGGRRRTSRQWGRQHEEYLAREFEHYVAGGAKTAPTPGLKAIFNAYGEWGRTNLEGGVRNVPQEVREVFDEWFRVADQSEPKATFDADEYRWMQALMQSFTMGEEQAHTRHYYKRGRSWTERSVNHPYLGMYPASYMWGKVLPAMIRFLVAKPFGVDAPFAGALMAKHAAFYAQLMIQTNPEMQDFIEKHPETIRMFQMMLPGTPWDIPVNMPAWARHAAEDAAQNRLRTEQGLAAQPTDFGKIIEDTVAYAFGGPRAIASPFNLMSEWNGANTPEPDDAANVWSQIGL